MRRKVQYISFLSFSLLFISALCAQSSESKLPHFKPSYNNEAKTDTTSIDLNTQPKEPKRFRLGLYVGGIIANNYTANIYNGYGYDQEGNQNTFYNSWMYEKIVNQYGGFANPALPDQIALELNVEPGTWTFEEEDMQNDISYNPGFNVGLNTRYSVDEDNGIILNVNMAQITAGGSFNIRTQNSSNQLEPESQNSFSIFGKEQRMILQFGYQRIFANDQNVSFFIEGGINATFSKFSENKIIINNLVIDLTNVPNDAILYPNALPIQKQIGAGVGVFAGFGLNIKTTTKYSAQLVYSPSMERINLGVEPKYTLQHGIGVRIYYNF